METKEHDKKIEKEDRIVNKILELLNNEDTITQERVLRCVLSIIGMEILWSC